MSITEHNCEEYFLRYVDDELTEAERTAVEDFLRQNPHCKTSFEVLLQAKLSLDEEIIFPGIDRLYREEENEIGIDNYQTYFLLYTDNELGEKEKAATERFVLQHPHLQRDFTLLQQTRLPAESIEFENKEKLFRKEKAHRVLPLYLGRWAAAASVVALLALTWQFFHRGIGTTGTAMINIQPKSATIPPSDKPVVTKENTNSQLKKSGDTLETIIARQKETKLPAVKENKPVLVLTLDTERPITPEIVVQLHKQDLIQQQQIQEIALQPQPATVKSAEVLKPLDDADNEETSAQPASLLASDKSVTAQPAVYKELDTNEDNHTLYVGSLQLNKTKVNGFLKSASRLLGNKAKGSATE